MYFELKCTYININIKKCNSSCTMHHIHLPKISFLLLLLSIHRTISIHTSENILPTHYTIHTSFNILFTPYLSIGHTCTISYLPLHYPYVIQYPTYPNTIHMLYNIIPSRILSICYTISFLLLNYRYIIHTSYYILPVAYSGLGCSWLPDPCGLFSWSPGNTCRGLPVRPTGTWWGWLGFGFCAHTGNPT